MTTNIRNDIAQYIRTTDGGNRLDPSTLGVAIEDFLQQDHDNYTVEARALADLIQRINPNKRMGAGALADAIVDHFKLDEEIER